MVSLWLTRETDVSVSMVSISVSSSSLKSAQDFSAGVYSIIVKLMSTRGGKGDAGYEVFYSDNILYLSTSEDSDVQKEGI